MKKQENWKTTWSGCTHNDKGASQVKKHRPSKVALQEEEGLIIPTAKGAL